MVTEGKRLAGKVALVTGSATGIGRESAIGFAREGADVLVADMVGAEDAATVLAEIAEAGARGVFVRTDVSDEASVRAMAARAIAEFGRVDSLANSGGICTGSLLTHTAGGDGGVGGVGVEKEAGGERGGSVVGTGSSALRAGQVGRRPARTRSLHDVPARVYMEEQTASHAGWTTSRCC